MPRQVILADTVIAGLVVGCTCRSSVTVYPSTDSGRVTLVRLDLPLQTYDMVARQPFESKPAQGEDGLESLRSTQSRQALRRSWNCLAAFVVAGVVAVLSLGVILSQAFGEAL